MNNNIVSALKEKVQDIAMIENSIIDNRYTLEEVLQHFPSILDAEQLANDLWDEWIVENPLYVPTYSETCIEFRHIRFQGKANILAKMTELIVADFNYTNPKLSLDERKLLLSKCWCFN